MISEESKKHLIRAGWYEGRKIDITEQVEYLESHGYEVFDAAKKFMEVYGELDIIDPYIASGRVREEHHSTCIKDLIYINNYKNENDYRIEKLSGEKVVPAIRIEDELYLYISESGKFYEYRGLYRESSDELWDSMYTEDGMLPLTWKDIAEGKKRSFGKRKLYDYIWD